MSSGLTADRSGGGAGAAALPSLAALPSALVPAGAELAPAGAPAFAAGALSVGLSLGPGAAATLAATSSDDSATTFEAARMRVLQPALTGDPVRRVQTGCAWCNSALYPIEC